MSRPRRKTLERVFAWLGEYGFSVYGGYIDPDSGQEQPGCRDYNVDEVIRVARMIDQDETWREGEG